MLFKQESRPNQIKQSIHQSKKCYGFSDLLNFLYLLDDSTVIHQDGALSRHYRYVAPDLDSATDDEHDYHSNTWKHALSLLGDNWMIETNVITHDISSYHSSTQFPELISALVDDEKRMMSSNGNIYKTEYYLSVTCKFNANKQLGSKATLEKFEQKISEFIGILSKSNELIVLKNNALVTYLYQCINGENLQLVAPYQGAFLNTYLASYDFIAGPTPKLGNKHIKIITIDDLPPYSYPNILSSLNQMPITYRWSSRFIALDKLTASGCLNRRERSWSSKAIGLMGILKESLGMQIKINLDAEHTAETIREAQFYNSSGDVNYGFYNSVIVLMDSNIDTLNQITKSIVTHIQQLNFKVRIEDFNTTEAYLGSIPSHGDYNLRKLMVDSNYISHALPMSAIYQGKSTAPCPYYGNNKPPLLLTETKGNRPFWLNCHVGDVGHTAVLGPTGSGKSTLIGAMILGHRKYEGSRIVILDKDHSHRSTVKALGGEYFDISDSSCRLAPLLNISKDNPESIDKVVHWLAEVCEVQGVMMTPSRLKSLNQAVTALAYEEPGFRNLKHLSIQEPELRQAIQTFCHGNYSNLLNGTGETQYDKSVIGFDMSALVQPFTDDYDLHIPVIKAIFNELETLFQDKRPTLLVLEEAWMYLKHPLFLDKLRSWFKTLRKSNVAVIFVSQDLSDIQADAASIIQNACMTRIYLPNKAANEPAVKKFYELFGLNSKQIDIVRHAIPKKEYFYESPDGKQLFRLALGDIAESILCLSSKEDIAQFDLIHRQDPRWIIDWLAYKGLDDWITYIEQNYLGEKP